MPAAPELDQRRLREALVWVEKVQPPFIHLETLAAAAQFAFPLLPEKCSNEECVNGYIDVDGVPFIHELCNGSGQVWDEGIVEVVAKAIVSVKFNERVSAPNPMAQARAVLSALVGLLTEKEK